MSSDKISLSFIWNRTTVFDVLLTAITIFVSHAISLHHHLFDEHLTTALGGIYLLSKR